MSVICNEKYVVEDGLGGSIYVVKITDDLYFVNGFLFERCDGLDMTKFSDLKLCLDVVQNSLLGNMVGDMNWAFVFLPGGDTYGNGFMRVSLWNYPEDVVSLIKQIFENYEKIPA